MKQPIVVYSKDELTDILGETLVINADADLDGNTVIMQDNVISFRVSHQTIDESNGTYTIDNIKKCLQDELGDVDIIMVSLR